MSETWTVRDSEGDVLPHLAGGSRMELGRRIVATHYDPFRLHVSSSYREMFDRELVKVLTQKGWELVRVRTRAVRRPAQLELQLDEARKAA